MKSALLVAALSTNSVAGEGAAPQTTIRKVGFPNKFVNERAACGQREVAKSVMDPDYLFSILFHGFQEGTCPAIGYPHQEPNKVVVQPGLLPFLPKYNISYGVFSRDPTFVDVSECIGSKCGAELTALGNSSYTKDVAHCISPAFGPCVPKAWECLGDEQCRDALKCVPAMAKQCGDQVWKLVTDTAERQKITCVWSCNNDPGCIIAKCGKDALDCLDGKDKICHDAIQCVSKGIASCSAPAIDCIMAKGQDTVCRDNLQCVAHGASLCADPVVNMMTDTHISDLITCANQKCPAPAGTSSVDVALGELANAPAHYPEQLACMGLKCAGKVATLLQDKDTDALTACLGDAVDGCTDPIWDCLGNDACRGHLKCWTDGLGDVTSDLWHMVTDEKERQFDSELYQCVQECSSGSNVLEKAICFATKCGPKAFSCMKDATCKKALGDIPQLVMKCGKPSLSDPLFKKAGKCVGQVINKCGKAGLEMVRDPNLADLVTCNSQCTRPPTASQQSGDIVV